MDRISQLPETIIHHILFFFDTPAELVRMSVLSKTWFHLTASFPVLDFSIDDFTNVSRESFFKYVEYTTSRFCHQNVIAHTLKFNLITPSSSEPAELDIVNRCLELLLKNGVQVLEIDIIDSLESSFLKYHLPNVLLSVSVLQSLTIRGCELPSSLMVDVVQFKSLFHLTLEYIRIDEQIIKYLTTSCPLLQEFFIRCCHGFKRFCVCGHQSLKKVGIVYNTQVERIDIEAPNLSYLSVVVLDGEGTPQMNLASCTKLKKVSYVGDLLPNSDGVTNLLSNFPFVETFKLDTKFNNLKLSSHSLKMLVLLSNCDLEDIEFRTPNLIAFLSGNYRFFVPLGLESSLVSNSTHLKAWMNCYPDDCISATWFHKLRQFLDEKNGLEVIKLYMSTTCSLQDFKELGKLKAIELPPYELEHVDIQLETHEEASANIAFMDAVLWCCRPQSLTLRSSFPKIDFEKQSDIVRFTHEKLLQQEDQGHTKIQIVSPASETQNYLRLLKSFSMALPHARKTVTFIKQQAVQEEALDLGMEIS